MELTAQYIERFRNTEPATYGHFPGVGFMRPEMKPVNKNVRLAGPAYTVKLTGKDSGALYKALKMAPKGSVIVIDHSGDNAFASVGEMVARNAHALGLAGIVIDGSATDSLELEKMDFPVFCTSISVCTTNVFCVTGQYDIPIACSGAAISPGDIILGNADGIVVLPRQSDWLSMLETAEERERVEVVMRERFKKGIVQLLDVDPMLEANIPKQITVIREAARAAQAPLIAQQEAEADRK